jgi:hypothetical protein
VSGNGNRQLPKDRADVTGEAFIACYLHQDNQDPYLFTLYERRAHDWLLARLSARSFSRQRLLLAESDAATT